jgi:hypothetical protein
MPAERLAGKPSLGRPWGGSFLPVRERSRDSGGFGIVRIPFGFAKVSRETFGPARIFRSTVSHRWPTSYNESAVGLWIGLDRYRAHAILVLKPRGFDRVRRAPGRSDPHVVFFIGTHRARSGNLNWPPFGYPTDTGPGGVKDASPLMPKRSQRRPRNRLLPDLDRGVFPGNGALVDVPKTATSRSIR